MKQTVVLGNIITMDEKRPTAQAALVKDGVFAYIGEVEEAKRLAAADAKVLDYAENFIYPGFLESHCHGYFAGDRAIGQADLSGVVPTDYDRYREIIEDYIEKNPDRDVYIAAGWTENEEYVNKAYLDEICSDKPLIMNTGGGHSMLLNTKALEWMGYDAQYAKSMGYDLVHVDGNGEPDGYVCEAATIAVINKLPSSVEQAKRYLLVWQDMVLAHGFTAVGDAGVELNFKDNAEAYYELEQEGKLKLRTYGYMYVPDNAEDPKVEVARVAANEEGLSVHVHSDGSGATHFMLGCIEDAQKTTGNADQRNVLAHLHFVTDEDIRRMADTGSIPAVAPLWTPKEPGYYEQEVRYVGQELADQAYPIGSFFEAGADVAFHSDYPISTQIDVQRSIYMAETRALPDESLGGMATQRNAKEAITREQSLRALTINIARAWHQEHRMGSIEFGKLANMTVCDCDFLHDDIGKVMQANVIATIVDGEEVYRA